MTSPSPRAKQVSADYLLDGAATIAPGRGIFLPSSRRMDPNLWDLWDLCRFISEAVYDGRLNPEPGNEKRRLVLKHGAHPALRPAGLRFLPLHVPLRHDGCSLTTPPSSTC